MSSMCEINFERMLLLLLLLLHTDQQHSRTFQTKKKLSSEIQSEKVVDCGASLRESSVENLGRAAPTTREKRFV